MAGKLVVFDGIDGAGKTTLCSRAHADLSTRGIPHTVISLPRHGKPSSAPLEAYLAGKTPGTSPRNLAVLFALDHWASWQEEWGDRYRRGGIIIADRYVTSNLVYQGARLPPTEQSVFFGELESLEYDLLGLPRPDLVFWADVPVLTAAGRLRKRGGMDVNERDTDLLVRCSALGKKLAREKGWRILRTEPAYHYQTDVLEPILNLLGVSA